MVRGECPTRGAYYLGLPACGRLVARSALGGGGGAASYASGRGASSASSLHNIVPTCLKPSSTYCSHNERVLEHYCTLMRHLAQMVRGECPTRVADITYRASCMPSILSTIRWKHSATGGTSRNDWPLKSTVAGSSFKMSGGGNQLGHTAPSWNKSCANLENSCGCSRVGSHL